MNGTRNIIISIILCLLTGLITYMLIQRQQKRIAVVDAVKLFNSYNLKKDLEKQSGGRLHYLSGQLDSMRIKFEEQQGNKDENVKKEIFRSYSIAKQQFDNEYAQINQALNEMVWKRLNPLIDKYGKEHELHLIIGANGMGTVLYNDDFFDLTSDVITYVNKDYENER
jgi:outer membrane protein